MKYPKKGSVIPMKRFMIAVCFLIPFFVFGEMTLDLHQTVICYKGKYGMAAKELQRHLSLISGKKIPLNPAEIEKDSYVIQVGKIPAEDTGKLLPEEGRWIFMQKEAYFYGDGSGGTLNAVYRFLEDELHVRWPAGLDIAYRQRNPVQLRKNSGSWHPVLRLREIRTGQKASMIYWATRMLSGKHNMPRYGHAFPNWWERFGKTHPEYFAMNKGRRFPIAPDGSRKEDITISNSKYSKMIALCVSNPRVAEQILKDWDRKSDLNLCENDAPANHSCHCSGCIALDPRPGKELNNNMGADRYIDFANRVGAEAEKIRPGTLVTMYAYNASEQPPEKIRIASNILLGIVPTDFRSDRLMQYVQKWKKAGMKNFFYRPNWHHYYRPMGFPLGNDKHAFDILQFMIRSGAIAFDFDATEYYDVFRWRMDYILYHAMAHPEKSFEYWEKHYAESYGEACGEVVEYFRYWRMIWDTRIYPRFDELASPLKNPYFSLIFTRNGKVREFYKAQDFQKTGELLARGLRKNLSPEERRRLTALKEFNDHAALMLQAVTTEKFEDAQKVKQFREKHKLPKVMPFENYLDDFCGLKRLADFSQYDFPVMDTPRFWHFRFDTGNDGVREKWYALRDFSDFDGMMPTDSPWEQPSRQGGHPTLKLRQEAADYDGVAWYSCLATVPTEWKGKRRIWIYFGAVDEAADVWVNGKKVGNHPFLKPNDWETPFAMEITGSIQWNSPKQLISVRVTDNAGNGGIWKRVYIVSRKK